MIEARPHPAVVGAVEQAAAALDYGGTRALRVLLHAGVSALWPAIKAAPERQVRTYESTIAALRRRWDRRTGTECVADPDVSAVFHDLDADVAAFLKLCAERSHTEWLEPIEAIAAYSVAVMQGTVLRWLADCDDETTLVVLDDLVSSLSTKAVER
ncbi:TetR family transcriptional regulator [Nocardia terpenica]|uniref:TetR family transcriptional regulator n=1 Tax=Nocardia terpenica TaxID=455432 RepID=UPI001893B168|nr:TetR family transcriptional regulator [Nocardia terpenica]MBF6060928.1 TetR family transcriptional regulator [Nocardia terpenica]MBF6111438.1 TetR family transcriptional regulator [Nocardia terpenica]MBF6118409.1 TetR family transcriptional regulator [Nocardia terpenica]MBF6155731.1 TetR family transcriptional regulator [Nocardia terpenica]